MKKTYSLKRLKTITSHAGLARWLVETDDEPVGWLARRQVADIPSPYAYSPTKQILNWSGRTVVYFETAHKQYEIFEVPATMLRFKSDAEATDYHVPGLVLQREYKMNIHNLALHEYLLSIGYTHSAYEAEYGDDGDGESGPMPWGFPAYDEYTGPDEYVFYTEMGVADHQKRDLEAERFYGGSDDAVVNT